MSWWIFGRTPTPVPAPVVPVPAVKVSGPSDAGIRLIEAQEGCILTAQRDVDTVWILGYGCKMFDGKPVVQGQTTDAVGADRNCRLWAQQCANGVLSAVKVPLTQGQLDSLTDFVYNTGLGALQQSTLLKTINNGQPVTENLFTMWNKIHDKNGNVVPLAALTARRKIEYQFYIS